MRVFDVSCYNRTTGRVVWSMSQEALTPAYAIAQACLQPRLRDDFASQFDDAAELTVDHPHEGMEAFVVTAVERRG